MKNKMNLFFNTLVFSNFGPMEQLKIYIKGAGDCSYGICSYCALLVYKGVEKTVIATYEKSKASRMEIMAMIGALESLKKDNLDIVFYVKNINVHKGIEGTMKRKLEKRKAVDLWEEFRDLGYAHNITSKMMMYSSDRMDAYYMSKAENYAREALKSRDYKRDFGFEIEMNNTPVQYQNRLWH